MLFVTPGFTMVTYLLLMLQKMRPLKLIIYQKNMGNACNIQFTNVRSPAMWFSKLQKRIKQIVIYTHLATNSIVYT